MEIILNQPVFEVNNDLNWGHSLSCSLINYPAPIESPIDLQSFLTLSHGPHQQLLDLHQFPGHLVVFFEILLLLTVEPVHNDLHLLLQLYHLGNFLLLHLHRG